MTGFGTGTRVIVPLYKLFIKSDLVTGEVSDQGSNFMFRVFAQVLKQLNVKHFHSRAYHPERQVC